VRIDRDAARIYGIAIACGLVAEIGLAAAIYAGGPRGLALLFFVEAIILGFVFGARPGMVAAVVPLPVMFLIDAIGGNPVGDIVAPLVFVAILQAFFAGMTGAMKARYLA
jgi:hypothetical protein